MRVHGSIERGNRVHIAKRLVQTQIPFDVLELVGHTAIGKASSRERAERTQNAVERTVAPGHRLHCCRIWHVDVLCQVEVDGCSAVTLCNLG